MLLFVTVNVKGGIVSCGQFGVAGGGRGLLLLLLRM